MQAFDGAIHKPVITLIINFLKPLKAMDVIDNKTMSATTKSAGIDRGSVSIAKCNQPKPACNECTL